MMAPAVNKAILILGLVLVLTISLIGLLILRDKTVPDVFEQTITASVVGLVGLLGLQKQDATPEKPMPVEVYGEPVKVEQTTKASGVTKKASRRR